MEKRKFDLYVHGDLISRGYCSCGDMKVGSQIIMRVPYDEVDTKHGIIVEGDMIVDNIYTIGKKIGASGFIGHRGFFSEEFKSAKGTNQ